MRKRHKAILTTTFMARFHDILWFWLPPTGYMLAIFFVSSLSNPQIGGETPDYILHTLEYFLLTLLLIRLLLSRQWEGKDFAHWQKACLWGIMFAVGYGITDEIHQYFIPGRHCSLMDVFSDAFGAFLAYGAALSDYILITRCPGWMKLLKQSEIARTVSYAGHWEQ